MESRVFESQKHKTVVMFNNLLENCRDIIKDISKDKKLSFEEMGVVYPMKAYDYDENESDVNNIENGVICLNNGIEIHVDEITNVTTLVFLIENIEL